MKKLSILAAMFGILFITAPGATAEGCKKNLKDMTPEQKAEWKQKKEEKLKKCTEMGKSEEECKQKMIGKKTGKSDDAKQKWKGKKEGKSEEAKQEWKEKMNDCTNAGMSKEECKAKLAKKKGKDCTGKEKTKAGGSIAETSEPTPISAKEEKKSWWKFW